MVDPLSERPEQSSELPAHQAALRCVELPVACTDDHEWIIVEEGFTPEREHELESLFAIGNGYVGSRGSLAEGSALSAPATFVAGVFDTEAGVVPGLAPSADWTRLSGATMSAQLNGSSYETDAVISFAPNARSVSDNADQVDKAGQTILQLLHRAAGVAEDNSRHALKMAQKLSHQLRTAEDRIAELEAEIESYRDRAERAEQWLHRVYTEIEDRFLRQNDNRRGMNGAPQRHRA
jgi:Glycosyl hydrolase family 65, N-terminal domain